MNLFFGSIIMAFSIYQNYCLNYTGFEDTSISFGPVEGMSLFPNSKHCRSYFVFLLG